MQSVIFSPNYHVICSSLGTMVYRYDDQNSFCLRTFTRRRVSIYRYISKIRDQINFALSLYPRFCVKVMKITLFLYHILTIIVTMVFAASIQEAPDGSVCFNNCSGHGSCRDYTCSCNVGYHGDDCSHTFFSDSTAEIIPILSAGNFNLTRKNFTSVVAKSKFIMVGFSSPTCHKCILFESIFKEVTVRLNELNVKLARANVLDMRTIAENSLGSHSHEMPALVLFKKNKPLVYLGNLHSVDAIVGYVKKQLSSPVVKLSRVQDVTNFLKSRSDPKYSVTTTMVVGFFSEHEDVEEDDYDDFMSASKELQESIDVYVGIVTNIDTSEWFKKNKTIDRTPSMIVETDDGQKYINLNELYGEKFGIKEWIETSAVPLVGKLTGTSFLTYEKLGRPMLLMFLDLENEMSSNSPGRVVGGKSGEILNEALVQELRIVAKEHASTISFVYLDGNQNVDKMKALGLYGGKERLPSLAFNTKDGLQIPFPENLPINKDTLLRFCADFISGKLKSAADAAAMAKRALTATVPINKKNTAIRKERKKAPTQVSCWISLNVRRMANYLTKLINNQTINSL